MWNFFCFIFFQVKGLSSMTKETVCSPNTTNPTKTFNGTVATPTTCEYYLLLPSSASLIQGQ